jgi:nickel transport protein
MTRLLFFVLAIAIASSPAQAHLLKVFATVEGGSVSGYGFFVGGGRPEGSALIITDKDGRELYKGTTDERGAFSWSPPQPQMMTVTIDAGDGHVAHANLAAERFGIASTGQAQAVNEGPVNVAASPPPAADAPASSNGLVGCGPSTMPANLNGLIANAVDTAVARQVRPLMEAYSESDGRARLNDVVGGVGMIFGLAGVAMWATARRRVTVSGSPPVEASGRQEKA